MAKTESESSIFLVICYLLLAEMIYFLFALFYYNYYNPSVLEFWAIFGNRRPSLTAASSNSNSRTGSKSSSSDSKAISKSYDSKIDNFMAYGLDTILHCILLPLYLLGLMVNIGLRIHIETVNISVVNNKDSWFNHASFCRYGYVARIVFPVLSQYLLYIHVCARSLRMEWFRPQATRCNRLFPFAAILWMIFFFFLNLVPYLQFVYKPTDDGSDCVLQEATGTMWTGIVSVGVIVNVSLCFIVFWRPFCIQKQILKSLSSGSNDEAVNKDVLEVIQKINHITKRVCLLGTFGIIISWIAVSINTIFDKWGYFVVYMVIMIHLYIVLCLTFKDSKMKIFSFWFYCFKQKQIVEDEKQLSNVVESEKSKSSDSEQTSPNEFRIH